MTPRLDFQFIISPTRSRHRSREDDRPARIRYTDPREAVRTTCRVGVDTAYLTLAKPFVNSLIPCKYLIPPLLPHDIHARRHKREGEGSMKLQLELQDLDGMSVAMLAAASGNAANLRNVLDKVHELEAGLSQCCLHTR